MDSITHNGEVYLKASILAKRFRYTTDYIGQLCRQNKVAAELVGRAWYVSEASLKKHQIDRKGDTRSAEILSKNKHEIEAVPVARTQVAVHAVVSKKTHRQFFGAGLVGGAQTHWHNRTAAYSDDSQALLPAVKTKSLSVSEIPAPRDSVFAPESVITAQKIKIKDVSEYPKGSLSFTDVPEVALSGDLSITSLDTESDFSETEPVVLSDFEEAVLPPQRPGVVLRYQKTARPRLMVERSSEQKPVVPKPHVPVAIPVEFTVPRTNVFAGSRVRTAPLLAVGIILVSIGVASCLVAVSTILNADQGVVSESFSFNINSFKEALLFLSVSN